MRDEPNVMLRCPNIRSFRYHKRCWFILTAGRWPWKSESAKECVTTHLPNELALKMDGAQALHLRLGFCIAGPFSNLTLKLIYQPIISSWFERRISHKRYENSLSSPSSSEEYWAIRESVTQQTNVSEEGQ